jgi:hypothetical protein
MLWKEFVLAFKGRAQLYWSPGLAEELGLDAEKTDEEEAARVDAEDTLVVRVTPENWALVARHKLRGLVLEVLRAGTWSDVELLLSRFRVARSPVGPPNSYT